VLAFAALLRPAVRSAKKPEPLAVVVGVALIVLGTGCYLILGDPPVDWIGRLLAIMVGLSLPIVFARRARAFGVVALSFVIVIALGKPASAGRVLFVGRSFFGMHKVIEGPDGSYRLLQHGSTVHGRQQMAGAACQPTSYYVPESPIGHLFSRRQGRVDRVGIIGLGSGGLACYAEAGERWTFYEIDPLVDAIARNPAYFTQLQNSKGTIDVVLGDGRITLQQASAGAYDVLILDAFSSDAIPLHLLTREALQLYLSRLAPEGVIALHISNRYLNLEPMLAALIRQEGLHAVARVDDQVSAEEVAKGRLGSHWIMISRQAEPLADLNASQRWREPAADARVRPWTDDYSNILSVLTYSRR
jgi:spermidine synthase